MMTLVNQCKSFCGEDDDPTRVPIVTVADSTHLRVSWHGLFTGCQPNEVKNMNALVEHISAQNTWSFKTIPLNFEEKEGLLPSNPCLQYKIYLRLFSHSDKTWAYRDSKIVKYNDISHTNIVSLYSGLLQDEGFMEKICLKEEGVITIPDPPEGVSDCILTRGDQENDEFTAPGQSHFVPLKTLNPANKELMTITAMVNGIEKCDQTATPVPTNVPTTTSPSDPILKLGGVDSVTIFTASILGTAFAVALITATICHFKKKKRSEGVRAPKVDENADYGLYYSTAGVRLDEGTMEMTDQNPYYGGE